MTPLPMPTPPMDDAHDDAVDDGIAGEVSRTLGEIAPWAISIVAHVVLVLLAVFLVWTTVLVQEEEPWAGESSLMKFPPIEHVDFEVLEESDAQASAATSPILPQVLTENPNLLESIGLGDTALVLPIHQIGPTNPNPGDGDGDGIINSSPIFDPVGRQTVFVIDASGSLIDTFPMVVHELKRFLSLLDRAEQERQSDVTRRNERPYSYSVVFFRDGEVLVQDRRGLRPANRDTVTRTSAWLDGISPGGSTSPLAAIELALSYQPDTLVVLSDNITGHGIHELNANSLVDRILRVRGSDSTVINTVQFLYPDPQEAYGQKGTLQRLADETGGAYRFVTDRELNLR